RRLFREDARSCDRGIQQLRILPDLRTPSGPDGDAPHHRAHRGARDPRRRLWTFRRLRGRRHGGRGRRKGGTMSDTESGRRDGFSIFLVIACVALSGLVVALAIQNRSLKQQIAHAGGPPPPQLAQGDVVTPFPVVTDTGESKTIGFGEGETK